MKKFAFYLFSKCVLFIVPRNLRGFYSKAASNQDMLPFKKMQYRNIYILYLKTHGYIMDID